MWKPRWLFALPLALAASLGSAQASSIRDGAGLFSRDAIRQAEAKLDRIEDESRVTTTIETVDSLEGEGLRAVAVRHAERSRTQGLFVLIAKQEGKTIVLVSGAYKRAFPQSRLEAIQDAIDGPFKQKRDFDAGLLQGVASVGREVDQAKAENGGTLRNAAPVAGHGAPLRGRRVGAPRPTFGVGSLFGIGLAIIAILFVLRLIGGAFGGGARGYPPGRMGAPGYGPGYGGGGGGFWSSMMGGIGGALAGNWLYDQFSGRHHGGTTDNSSWGSDTGQAADDNGGWSGTEGGDWGGGGGGGGDWGGGGAGGDWGGGDGGGGGDW